MNYWKIVKRQAEIEFPAPGYAGRRTADNIRSIIPQIIAEKQKFGTGVHALSAKYHVSYRRVINLMNDSQFETFEELCKRDKLHRNAEWKPRKRKRRKKHASNRR